MKKIAVLNDLSGLGKCSLTAAIPVISVMGVQACPLPTAVLSARQGFRPIIMMIIQSIWKRSWINGKK